LNYVISLRAITLLPSSDETELGFICRRYGIMNRAPRTRSDLTEKCAYRISKWV